jgi:hypothetical protein
MYVCDTIVNSVQKVSFLIYHFEWIGTLGGISVISNDVSNNDLKHHEIKSNHDYFSCSQSILHVSHV